jgi:hypothetical protein
LQDSNALALVQFRDNLADDILLVVVIDVILTKTLDIVKVACGAGGKTSNPAALLSWIALLPTPELPPQMRMVLPVLLAGVLVVGKGKAR